MKKEFVQPLSPDINFISTTSNKVPKKACRRKIVDFERIHRPYWPTAGNRMKFSIQ